jgi:thioredoxin reductase
LARDIDERLQARYLRTTREVQEQTGNLGRVLLEHHTQLPTRELAFESGLEALALLPEELISARWPMARRPYLMETSIPGVFCVGDARSNSVKRVASAVGEGSICIQLVHRALQEL